MTMDTSYTGLPFLLTREIYVTTVFSNPKSFAVLTTHFFNLELNGAFWKAEISRHAKSSKTSKKLGTR